MVDMGTGEAGPTTSKTTKTSTPQLQEQAPSPMPTPVPYPDWAAAFQVYYGSAGASMPPRPGYFPSPVGSPPQPHPYMWGAQPLMPPYGTPPPYAAMYPHGAMFPHPSMTPGAHPYSPYNVGAAGNGNEPQTNGTCEGDQKPGDNKHKNSSKKSKESLGSLGMLMGKDMDGKRASGAMNGAFSHSHESGTDGSSDGSEGNSRYGSDAGHKDQAANEASIPNSSPYRDGQQVNHGESVPAYPVTLSGKQVVGAGPLTNLNIGMDYWNGAVPPGLPTKRATASGAGPSRDGAPGELWIQDERELKRQKRKQSNRESARRSRLRKQAECEELAAKVQALEAENSTLQSQLAHITEQCNKLSEENSSLMAQLRVQGEGAASELVRNSVNHPKAERKGVENIHFRRMDEETNDSFSIANESGSLAVPVPSG